MMPTLLSKALRTFGWGDLTQKASRGTLGQFVLNAPHEYGQPRPGIADVNGLISPERMREIVLKTPTPAACRNTIVDFAIQVPIRLRSIDPTVKVPLQKAKFVRSVMARPNPVDTWRQFLYQIYTDTVTIGWAAAEIERGPSGRPANLWPLDAARLYIDFDEHGQVLGYDMMNASGFPIHGPDGVHAWDPEDIILYRLNPQTDSLYPSSRIQQLFAPAVIENLMLAFIGERFTDSNVPFGVYDIGDVTPEEVQKAITLWNAQVRSNHRVMITGSKNGGKWNHFGYALRELEAKDLLEKIRSFQMGVMGVTMNELGESENINKSNGYSLSYTFKKRAIEPLLGEFCDTTTRRLFYDELGWDDVELGYDEIDSRDELLQAQIDESYLKAGGDTFNSVLNRRGKPSVPGGDIPMAFTGSAWVPVTMLEDFAKAELKVLKTASSTVTPPKAAGSMPGPEGMPLDGGGKGKSTATVKVKPAGAASQQPQQKPRGTKAAAKSAGIRND